MPETCLGWVVHRFRRSDLDVTASLTAPYCGFSNPPDRVFLLHSARTPVASLAEQLE